MNALVALLGMNALIALLWMNALVALLWMNALVALLWLVHEMEYCHRRIMMSLSSKQTLV